jgi:hypothetical protein
LDALVPGFLPAVPFDIMDGKPLRYRPGGRQAYVLYSVGLDGKDDGGDPTLTGDEKRRSIWSGRDALWPALTPR